KPLRKATRCCLNIPSKSPLADQALRREPFTKLDATKAVDTFYRKTQQTPRVTDFERPRHRSTCRSRTAGGSALKSGYRDTSWRNLTSTALCKNSSALSSITFSRG